VLLSILTLLSITDLISKILLLSPRFLNKVKSISLRHNDAGSRPLYLHVLFVNPRRLFVLRVLSLVQSLLQPLIFEVVHVSNLVIVGDDLEVHAAPLVLDLLSEHLQA